MSTGAVLWILGADFEHVLVDMVVMRLMQVAVVEVVDVAVVLDGRMPAVGAVDVIVVVMLVAALHDSCLPKQKYPADFEPRKPGLGASTQSARNSSIFAGASAVS